LGSSDGEILVALNPERHRPTAHWMKTLRETLPRVFPGVTFFFQPADIVSQILNFGLPAPIDVQVTGFNQQATHEIALEVAARMPQSRVDSVNTLMTTSVTPGTAGPPQLRSNLASLERREVPAVISHSNVQPVFDIYANVQDRYLGSVAAAVQTIAAELRA